MEREYPFRQFARDLLSWFCATDLQPHQQAAVTVLNLGGAARDLTRELNPLEMLQGGAIPPAQPGGQPVLLDAMSFLMCHLQERFAPLGEATMLSAAFRNDALPSQPRRIRGQSYYRFQRGEA